MRYFERKDLHPSIQGQLDIKKSTVFELTKAQRKEIRAKLYVSQQAVCAYCERRIKNIHIEKLREKGTYEDIQMASHIDHFVEQHDDISLIFKYENMLLSCEGDKIPEDKKLETPTTTIYRRTNISCGCGKENSRHGTEIDYNLLLNPTKNVSNLFSYVDGVIEPSNICTIARSNQVEYTIKRFNLSADRLENERVRKIREIRNQLKGLTIPKQKVFIQDLLNDNKSELEPFFSTIKDNFGFILL